MTDAQKDQAIGRTSPWELAIGPEPEDWDDWVEYDAQAWPEREAVIAEAMGGELAVDEGVQDLGGLADRCEADRWILGLNGEPLITHRRHVAGIRRIGRDEGGVRQRAGELRCELSAIRLWRLGAVPVRGELWSRNG